MVEARRARAGRALNALRKSWPTAFIVLALTGAALADRFAPTDPPLPSPDAPAKPGGVWACPFVKAAGSPGWLHFANLGSVRSHVRVTYLPDRKAPVPQVFDVGPGRAGTLATPGSIRASAAGAIVEYAGGDLVVTRTAFLTANGGTGGAAAPCGKPGAQVLVAAQGGTLGLETQLILLNPGASDALVDISLVFGGQTLEPESLRGRIVPARGRLVVREGDFAFDERSVAAVVRIRSGRVVADALLAARGLIELVPAVGAQRETVAMGSSKAGTLLFAAVAVGEVDAVTEGRTLTTTGQGVFEALASGLPPNLPLVGGIPEGTADPGPIAVAVSSSTAPVALGSRWQVVGRGGIVEQAATAAIPPSNRAVAVIGPPAIPANLRLLIANPTEREARLTIRVATENGLTSPAALQGVTVSGGHAMELSLAGVAQSGTVAVLVTSTGAPIAAAIQAIAFQPSFGVYAVTAIPELPRPIVAVDPDPRAGVAAA